jgi:hypothetical protein
MRPQGHLPDMAEHEQPQEPARQTEQENQQYPDHGRPDELRKKVGLPPEDDKRQPEDNRGG